MMNSLTVYTDAGTKAGRAARKHDAGLVRHWGEWMRRAYRLEAVISVDDAKLALRTYDQAYSAEATPPVQL